MRRGLGSRMMFRGFRGRVMLLRRCMMLGGMMFRSTMVLRGAVMLGSSMMLRPFVFGLTSCFRQVLVGFLNQRLVSCLGQRRFPGVTFVLPEFLGVVMHGVTLMSTLFLG